MTKKFINLIRRHQPQLSKEQLEQVEYGLHSFFLLISKLFVILTVGFFFNVAMAIVVFMVIHFFMKMHTFGLHTQSSWTCFWLSLILFILLPYIAINTLISFPLKVVIGSISVPMIYKNSPADTHKKPIINRTKRRHHQISATTTALLFVVLSLTVSNDFVANSFLFSLMIQTLTTSPVVYSWLKLPYNNYLKFAKGGVLWDN